MKTKTIVITLMFVLCLGLVTAVNVHSFNPTTSNAPIQSQGNNAGMESSKPAQPIVSSSSSTSSSSGSKKSGGALLTKLMWNGEECVKAPVLSRSFKISPTSRMIVPHIVVKVNEDGSRIIQRVFSDKYTIVWDAEKRRIDKSGTCNVNEPYQLLEINWWSPYSKAKN